MSTQDGRATAPLYRLKPAPPFGPGESEKKCGKDAMIATWGRSEEELMGEYKEIRRVASKKRNGK
jgi:hypothetical protein